MDTSEEKLDTIDEYMAMLPEDLKATLATLRQVIMEEAPGAMEAIKYRMPTFTLNGHNLVHFAAFKSHVGFYPTPSPMEPFREDLAQYKTSKGAIQFPLDQPMPLPLIRRIVRFRVEEVRQKTPKK